MAAGLQPSRSRSRPATFFSSAAAKWCAMPPAASAIVPISPSGDPGILTRSPTSDIPPLPAIAVSAFQNLSARDAVGEPPQIARALGGVPGWLDQRCASFETGYVARLLRVTLFLNAIIDLRRAEERSGQERVSNHARCRSNPAGAGEHGA